MNNLIKIFVFIAFVSFAWPAVAADYNDPNYQYDNSQAQPATNSDNLERSNAPSSGGNSPNYQKSLDCQAKAQVDEKGRSNAAQQDDYYDCLKNRLNSD